MKKIAALIALTVILFAPRAFSQGVNDLMPFIILDGQKFYYYDIKKDESLYGIAHKLGWSEAVIQTYNPALVAEPMEGMRIFYPESQAAAPASSIKEQALPEKGVVNHTVQPGESLGSIAAEHAASVRGIFMLNSSLTPDNLHAGAIIRVPQGELNDKMRPVQEEHTAVEFFTPRKIKKGDTYSSIARETGASVETLRKTNDAISNLKRGNYVSVPTFGTYTVTGYVADIDPMEATFEGIQQIYEDIRAADLSDPDYRFSYPTTVNFVLLLSDPKSKKDLEIARGALLALDMLKEKGLKVNFRVETLVRGLRNLDEVARDADIIVATCDKSFPKALADYGTDHGAFVVNLFDMKSPYNYGYPFMVNMITPSSLFNSSAAEYFASELPSKGELIMVGSPADIRNDAIASQLSQDSRFPALTMTLEEFEEYPLTAGKDYVVYSTETKRDNIEKVLDRAKAMTDETPGTEVTIVGRPNWVLYSQVLADKFAKADLYIPSRFYFDPDDPKSQEFVRRYRSVFNSAPQATFPSYAVHGYDLVSWFVPNLSRTPGYLDQGVLDISGLQNDFRLERELPGYSFGNNASYILHFLSDGSVTKTEI